MPISHSDAILIYDEECFFCSNYVRLVNLRATLGNIILINARERDKVLALGFEPADLNEGFILLLNEKMYVGAEAIHHIALVSTSNGFFNRLNRAVFKSRFLSILLYPALKTGRRIYLFLARKPMIS